MHPKGLGRLDVRVLDLFSGIGGFSLGLERAGMSTVAFCETDDYCRRVLAKHWPNVPCHGDIRELKGDAVGPVQLVCGGFPCQPFSVAGKRAGADDDRHLWPEMYRLVDELRPTWIVGENVAGLINMGLDQVLSDLEGCGYACRTFAVPACAVDAPHRRERLWIVAHADGDERRSGGMGQDAGTDGRDNAGRCREGISGAVAHGSRFQPGRQEQRPERQRTGAGGEQVTVADADRTRELQSEGFEPEQRRRTGDGSRWLPEPNVGRVAHGVPRRVDRLRALGNAVVPQVVEMIGHAIMQAEAA